MKRLLFFLPSLGNGGAEKVLVNLVNHLDKSKYDVTVMTLFDTGVNKALLALDVNYVSCKLKYFKGLTSIMKLFSPKLLHKLLVKGTYDIQISYLEGITTRIMSGCDHKNAKVIAWVHTEFRDMNFASKIYRSPIETEQCYQNYDKILCVSRQIKDRMHELFSLEDSLVDVQYNVIDSEQVIARSKEKITDCTFSTETTNIIGVGKVIENKGFDRLARITKKLIDDGCAVHTYIVGEGNQQSEIESYLQENNIENSFSFLGYQDNPYKYVKACDIFVCSSHREGFSTAATEALIVGTTVVTTDVSGMEEMLGDDNEYGIISSNDEEDLYKALKDIITNKDKLNHYTSQAEIRGKTFSVESTIKSHEAMFDDLLSK